MQYPHPYRVTPNTVPPFFPPFYSSSVNKKQYRSLEYRAPQYCAILLSSERHDIGSFTVITLNLYLCEIIVISTFSTICFSINLRFLPFLTLSSQYIINSETA